MTYAETVGKIQTARDEAGTADTACVTGNPLDAGSGSGWFSGKERAKGA